jgi:hypothetical protein
MRLVAVCILVCLGSFVQAQNTIVRGRILDKNTRKPVSFASVVNKSQGRGTSSNIDGTFSISVQKAGETLLISSIGYQKTTVQATEDLLTVYLVPDGSNMDAIVIRPNNEQDPLALRIIRRAIANRNINDPEELGSFSYNSYSKGIVDTLRRDMAKRSGRKVSAPSTNPDTGRYQFMVESYFEHKYRKPGLFNNRMTAQRVSGLGNPYIIGLITQIQYYSFYKDNFSMLGTNYRNPISGKYYAFYVFSLLDSIQGMDGEMVYSIAFRPRYNSVGKDLLTGQVFIHGKDYAIVNVEASAYNPSSLSAISFKQQYSPIEGRWFPTQLQTQLTLLPSDDDADELRDNNQDDAVRFHVISYIKDIAINPDIPRRNFTGEQIVVDEASGSRTDSYWDQRRAVPLENSELRTYQYLDSVFEQDKELQKANLRMDVAGYLISGKVPIGNVSIDLREVIKLNGVENVRLGIGLSTNDRFSEKHKFGGNIGYGFKDRTWKYGAYYEFRPERDRDLTFGILYRKDIDLWGLSTVLLPGLRPRNYQYLLINRADEIQRLELYSRFNVLKKVDARAFVNVQERRFNNGYGYGYEGNVFSQARLAEAGIQFSTRFKQAKFRYGSLELGGYSQDDPRFAIDLRAGQSIESGEGLSYFRAEGLFEHFLSFGRIGRINYQLAGGYLSGNSPYALLFSNLGTNKRKTDLFVSNTFTTMQPFEFTNTAYGALFTEFETGYVIQKRKSFGISLVFPNSIGIGRYDQQDIQHNGVNIQAMNNWYTETGIGFKFRSKKNFLGMAVMYRYGNYQQGDFGDNLFLRFLWGR